MKNIFISLLALAALPAHADPAKIQLASMYFGTFTLIPAANGKFLFRAETFGGNGVVQNVNHQDLLGPGVHYAVSGLVDCRFGIPDTQVFDCSLDTTTPSNQRFVTIERISDTPKPGEVVKKETIHVDYYTAKGSLVTTHDISGTRTQVVAETWVTDSGLEIELSQPFDVN